ncbi:MAG: DUF362 domain-containing protein [Candidatus Helarchaeota archaeon]|nr:DUF362 domain-containing protein [Candidatus Helarchaeota archaeon]
MSNLVYYAKTEQRKKFVHKILEIFKNQLKGKILIKPNHVSHEVYPTTTHIETIEAVIQFLESQRSNIFVGDGYASDLSKRKMKNTPIQSLCDKLNVPFIDFHKEKMDELTTKRGFKVNMSTVPFDEFDCIISLPVLKCHLVCTITGALKNVVGYFERNERFDMHAGKINIHKLIAEANWLLYNSKIPIFHLTIMDAVQTMMVANEFRHGGKPFDLGYIIAGTNPVALDVFGFKLLKENTPAYPDKEFNDVKHLLYSIEYGLGTKEYELQELNL